MWTHSVAAEEKTARPRLVPNDHKRRETLVKFILVGVVAALMAAPLAHAGGAKVLIAGTFVPPAQVSEAQLNAGHDPATRMVQIGGALVSPSQASAYQHGAGATSAAGTSDSSGLGTGGIAAIAVLGAFALLAAASVFTFRNRRRLATAPS